ncbi:YncE family protein [Stygiolobus caldivivus]|uniref:YncE family protein n=1 Tax=Stygiolobus caldivivus TaxID=2824673 RepID=A0A8D5ZIQ0_9CREN|nr:hypothetical protein [Stygiolobus caldivivus]BCU69826.1 hypothetical protein KN1_11230 [Stygiolobus caldivivus]
MKKTPVAISLLFVILFLSEIAVTAHTLVEYKVTASQETYYLYDGQRYNGACTATPSEGWELKSAVFDPVTGYVYAVNPDLNSVVVFDPQNDSYIGCITVGKDPVSISINPSNGYLYVANEETATVSVIDPVTEKVVNSIYVGGCPVALVYDPNDSYIYVFNYQSSGACCVLEAVNDKGVVAKIPLEYRFKAAVYDPVTGYVVFSDTFGNIYAVEGTKVVAKNTDVEFNGSLISEICALSVNPKTGVIYGVSSYHVLAFNPYTLNVTSGVQFAKGIEVEAAVYYKDGIVYTLGCYYSCESLYMADFNNDSVQTILSFPDMYSLGYPFAKYYTLLIDSNNGELISTGASPNPVAVINTTTHSFMGIGEDVKDRSGVYDPVTGMVYVADFYSDIIYAINPHTGQVEKILHTTFTPSAITYNPENGYLYVTSYKWDALVEENPYNGQIIWNTTVGKRPMDVVYDTANGLLYVANERSDTVTVVDPNNGSIVAGVEVGSDPIFLTYNPSNGEVYVADVNGENVCIINGTSVVGSIEVNFNPVTVKYINGTLFIAGGDLGLLGYTFPTLSVYNLSNGKYVVNMSMSSLPYNIYYDKERDAVYVLQSGLGNGYTRGQGTLTVLNSTDLKVVADIKVGVTPSSLAELPNGTLFVMDEGEGAISIVTLNITWVEVTTSTSVPPATTTSTVNTTSTTTSTITSTNTSTVTSTTHTTSTTAPAVSVSTSTVPPSYTTTSEIVVPPQTSTSNVFNVFLKNPLLLVLIIVVIAAVVALTLVLAMRK